jgi:1-acyl-sn-glycerol-3-phosphate acyltransferase
MPRMTLPHLVHAVVETGRISAPTLMESVIGSPSPDACDQRLASWSRKLLERAGIELDVVGLERAPADEAFVVMSNHQSLYDVPVMFQALQRRVRMVAKSELFKIPFWGRAMRAAGFVEVNRGDRQAAIAGLEHAKVALRQGTSIWIAPEGTRGPGDKLLPFKQGGFHLALSTGARILPVSIDGTSQVLAAHGSRVRPGARVRVTISDPISVQDYGPERREDLVADVRRSIAAHLSACSS